MSPPLDYKFHESRRCVRLVCSISPGFSPIVWHPSVLNNSSVPCCVLKVKPVCLFLDMQDVACICAFAHAISSAWNALPSAFTRDNGFNSQIKWTGEKVHLEFSCKCSCVMKTKLWSILCIFPPSKSLFTIELACSVIRQPPLGSSFLPWLVWLSGLSTGLRSERSLV